METLPEIEIRKKASLKKDVPETKDMLPEQEPDKGLYQFAIRQILKHHVHPVSVHIPNGVIPVSVIFIILAMISGCKAFSPTVRANRQKALTAVSRHICFGIRGCYPHLPLLLYFSDQTPARKLRPFSASPV